MDDVKVLTVRLPIKMWSFAKKQSIYQKIPVNKIIQKALEEYKINLSKKVDIE